MCVAHRARPPSTYAARSSDDAHVAGVRAAPRRRSDGRRRWPAHVREPPRPHAALEVADDRPPARRRQPLRLRADVHDLDDAGRLHAREPRDARATDGLLGHAAHATDSAADTRDPQRSPGCREPVGLSPRSSVRVRDAHGTPVKTGGRAVRTWLSGRASPCQGEGRGFESRRPLGGRHPDRLPSRSGLRSQGGVAERRGSGLQSRIRGFESHLHLVAPVHAVPRIHPGRLAQR